MTNVIRNAKARGELTVLIPVFVKTEEYVTQPMDFVPALTVSMNIYLMTAITGFVGKHCLTELSKCRKENPGDGCIFECGCRNGGQCDKSTGHCSCPPGFTVSQSSQFQIRVFLLQGEICEQPCTNNTYGDECSKICDCFNENTCDSVSGRCICVGFTGERCIAPCPTDRYGPECSKSCSCKGHGARCHPTNGSCVCGAGFKGRVVNQLRRLKSVQVNNATKRYVLPIYSETSVNSLALAIWITQSFVILSTDSAYVNQVLLELRVTLIVRSEHMEKVSPSFNKL